MSEKQPLSFEARQFGDYTRLSVKLDNGLIVILPLAIKTVEDIGEYETRTLNTLQTETGLNFVMKAYAKRRTFEVNLDIGDPGKPWFTTASVDKVNGGIVFSLYYGAN
jgi:hypothetical protein